MATAGVNRMMLWTDLEGRELSGRWQLGRLVRPEGRTAWFAATATDGKPLTLSITEALNDEEELLERLRAAAEICSPHVVAVGESILTQVDDTPVVLAAMEPTDENLGDVLRERTLCMAEAQGLLESLVQGLAAIHARGMIHGRMEPASVLAMGDTIKLRSDCLLLGRNESAWFAGAAAENVRGLGRIVTQAVTRRVPASENDVVLQLLPEPMARAVRRALSGNATIGEIAALAGVRLLPQTKASRPGPVAVGPVMVEAESPARKTASDIPAAESTVPRVVGVTNAAAPAASEPERPTPKVITMKAAEARIDAPVEAPIDDAVQAELFLRPSEKDATFELEDERAGRRLRSSAPWVIAAAVLIILATVWALYGLFHRGSSARTVLPAVTAPSTPHPANPPHPAGPGKLAAGAAQPNRAGATTVAVSTPGWRVIAYTYRHEAQAEQKAQSLAQRYPRLTPGVFTLHGGAPYLVTLGGVMSKADAEAMRRQAVGMGMPRDTYAQNYR